MDRISPERAGDAVPNGSFRSSLTAGSKQWMRDAGDTYHEEERV